MWWRDAEIKGERAKDKNERETPANSRRKAWVTQGTMGTFLARSKAPVKRLEYMQSIRYKKGRQEEG